MLLTGWNMKDALVVAREEGEEDGLAKGIGIGREEGIEIGMEKSREEILRLIKQGYSLADIENMIKARVGR
jgi:predicted transposase YdaD